LQQHKRCMFSGTLNPTHFTSLHFTATQLMN